MKKFNKRISLLLLVSIVITLAIPIVGFANETSVNLETADSFAILAGSTITNTGTTTISGDIGLDPGTSFTGQETLTVTSGAIYIDDAVALQAKNDLQAAYTDAAGRTSNTIGAELGGSTLTPGVYSSATSFGLTGTLILDGQNNSDAVFILQTAGTLTTATNSEIQLINGANAKNIYWQVGSSATLGTDSIFKGTILASESITATTRANIEGQLLALTGAVTLDSNTIVNFSSGSLTTEKIVTGDIGDMVLPEFEITLTGPEGFTSTRTFLRNESYTWYNLVPGEYTLTESRTGLSSEWTVSGEGTIQVVSDGSHVATITNAYVTAAESFGSLTVEKTVAGDIGDMTLPVFEITVTGPDGFTSTRTFVNNESYTWENLIPGEYEVTESRVSLNSNWTVSGEGTIQVVSDGSHFATITNLYDTAADSVGSLTVEKTVAGAIGDMTLPVFEITLTGPNGFTSTRTFVNNESYTWNNLIPGEYEVTESRVSLNSDWTVSGEGTIQVVSDGSHAATITNLYAIAADSVGSLTVGKTVSGDIGSMTLPVFEMTLTGPNGFTSTRTFVNNESYTWNNLIPGEYEVTESRSSLNSNWTVSGEGTVDVEGNGTHSVTITNLYNVAEVRRTNDRNDRNDNDTVDSTEEILFSSLTVEKIATGDIGDYILPEFEITVTGPENFSSTRAFMNNESYTWENLVPGEYDVTENRFGLDSQWLISGEGTIQLIEDEAHFVTITNLYTSAIEPTVSSLIVKKIVTGDIGDMTLPAFEIIVTGPEGFRSTRTLVNNESYTWGNLLPGEYNITENRAGLSSAWTVSGEGTVQVSSDAIENITITNSYEAIEVIPQTGQESGYNIAMIFGGLAVIMAGLGILLGNKRDELNE